MGSVRRLLVRNFGCVHGFHLPGVEMPLQTFRKKDEIPLLKLHASNEECAEWLFADLLCRLFRISVLKNASPRTLSDPLPLHLYIRQMAVQLLTLLYTSLF